MDDLERLLFLAGVTTDDKASHILAPVMLNETASITEVEALDEFTPFNTIKNALQRGRKPVPSVTTQATRTSPQASTAPSQTVSKPVQRVSTISNKDREEIFTVMRRVEANRHGSVMMNGDANRDPQVVWLRQQYRKLNAANDWTADRISGMFGRLQLCL